jgi:predicted RNase H-like nuclease (RuvC/YqgF family)
MKILTDYWEAILGVITGISGVIYGVKQKRTDNLASIQKIYDELIKDTRDRMDEMRVEIESLKEEVRKLHLENIELKSELSKYKKK